jgi:hypothetical protein
VLDDSEPLTAPEHGREAYLEARDRYDRAAEAIGALSR